MKFKRPLVAAALALAALTLSACIERKQTGAINPDGSGKVVIDTYMEAPPAPPVPPGGAPAPKPDTTEFAKQFATGFIAQAQGIDAWKDVTVETAKDGRAHILATAYFPDINKVKLDAVMPLSWTRDDKGNFTLTIVQEPSAAPASQPAPMTDAQITDEIAKQRAEYKQSLPMAQAILNTLKLDVTYKLPGVVSDANIFTKPDDTSVNVTIEGKKILASMDKIMADDKSIAEHIKAGKNISDDQDLMIENMFGKKGPIKATVAPSDKPLFDYKTEMEAAKAGQPDAFKKAGIDPSKAPPMPGPIMPGDSPAPTEPPPAPAK